MIDENVIRGYVPIEFSITEPAVYVFLIISILALLIDFKAHAKDEVISLRSATIWSIFWVAVACSYGAFLYVYYGNVVSSLFFTGYILEKTLSVDNLFVFSPIFAWFMIPREYQHRVLYYGIIGAIVFRLIFVLIGTSALSFGYFVEVIFGLIIIYTAYRLYAKLYVSGNDDIPQDLNDHPAYKFTKKFFPVTSKLHGHDFFFYNHKEKILYATPLFLCLMVIEFSDILFAFDSVPAVISVSKDPAIVYPAMTMAIFGLRTMFFMLEAAKHYFVYLNQAVIIVLAFIGFELVMESSYKMFGVGMIIDHSVSLGIVLTLVFGSIILSLIKIQIDKKIDTL